MRRYCELAHTSRNLSFTDFNSKPGYSSFLELETDGSPSLPTVPLW